MSGIPRANKVSAAENFKSRPRGSQLLLNDEIQGTVDTLMVDVISDKISGTIKSFLTEFRTDKIHRVDKFRRM